MESQLCDVTDHNVGYFYINSCNGDTVIVFIFVKLGVKLFMFVKFLFFCLGTPIMCYGDFAKA